MTTEAAADARSAGPSSSGAPHSYGQILRASAIVGGSQLVNVAAGIVRAKAVALLLGPAGFGLMGLYTSIANLAQSVAGMGVSGSGVRQIAAAVGSGETERIARTVTALRRCAILLGLAGATALFLLSAPVSRVTFGSAEHTVPVALLSLAVLFRVVSDGQGALVQGLRRIPDLARIAIYGGLVGTGAGIALVWLLRERGVVPALVAMAGASLLYSWWYSRRAGVAAVALSRAEFAREASALLKLGFAFMTSGMLVMGAAYVVRLIILRHVGFEAAGLYQASWTIGGLYVGFVLQSMGADFYPRLTAVIRDRPQCNRIVNEQALVSLLLAGPGVIATLILAPLVVTVFYSSEFVAAVDILRWICLGATLQVVTWPIGFIIVAEGRQGLFFAVELLYAVFHAGAAWFLVRAFGADGAGMAFFASYAFHGLVLYPVVSRLTGFRWSPANLRTGAVFLAIIGVTFAGLRVLPFWVATAVGVIALLASAAHSARTIVSLVPSERLPGPVRKVLAWVRRSPDA